MFQQVGDKASQTRPNIHISILMSLIESSRRSTDSSRYAAVSCFSYARPRGAFYSTQRTLHPWGLSYSAPLAMGGLKTDEQGNFLINSAWVLPFHSSRYCSFRKNVCATVILEIRQAPLFCCPFRHGVNAGEGDRDAGTP